MPTSKRPLPKKAQYISLSAWIIYWLTVCLLIVFVILSGAASFGDRLAMRGSMQSQGETLQGLVDQLKTIGTKSEHLEKEVADIQARMNARELRDEMRNSLSRLSDGRPALTVDAAKLLLPCSQLENYPFYSEPTTRTAVISLADDVRVRVPYDTRWGNDEFAVTSSERTTDQWINNPNTPAIRFGALRINNKLTCEWQRDYKVFLTNKRTTKEALDAEKARAAVNDVGLILESNTVTLGGHQAIHFTTKDMNSKLVTAQWTEVIGKNQNYIFLSMAKTATQAAIDNIIRSLAD